MSYPDKILDYLYDSGVVRVERQKDSLFLEEACDGYYSVLLSKKEALKFIKELQELTDAL